MFFHKINIVSLFEVPNKIFEKLNSEFGLFFKCYCSKILARVWLSGSSCWMYQVGMGSNPSLGGLFI